MYCAGVIFLSETIGRASLVDIQTVKLDMNLPAKERAASYLKQIKDPHCFLCGDVVVHLQFEEDGAALETRLANYFKSLKQA
jgi:hypothetical protein